MARQSDNSNLSSAKKSKMDEFYTQLSDIEKELRHYRKHFRGKTVFCNCDDPYESNFFKYFALNFNRLGLKKLIATCYAGSPIAGTLLSVYDVTGREEDKANKPYKAIVTKVYDTTGDGGVDMLDVAQLFKTGENELTVLEEDGDFRSPECVELLKESDIVVTNPPFSLFREFIATLVEYDKGFVVIGNKNALTYKEIFPLIMGNKMWVGATPMSREMYFDVPKEHAEYLRAEGRDRSIVKQDGRWVARATSIWYTNLDIKKRHEEMILIRKYSPETYPKYDNYDAIEVSKTVDIPMDYDGVMGVPITFLDKYNPVQFQIIGATESEGKGFSNGIWKESSGMSQPVVDGNRKYKRLFIKNRKPLSRERK